jgi:cysteine synthase
MGDVPPAYRPDIVDEIEPITDEEAIETTLRLAREEGIFAGISSGANVAASVRLAERLGADAVVVTLAVDSGFKYMRSEPYGSLAG